MSKECVTHHFACDCREEKFKELEQENAALRELTSTLGAPNHINVPVEQWHELRADKERLNWIIGKAHYLFFKELGSDLAKGREQIDAARKETRT